MQSVIMEQPLRRRVSSNPRPSGSAFAYMLIALLSAFGIASVAYGFSVLTGLRFLIGAIVAAPLYFTKMYFIRHQPPHEMMGGGWDRVVSYLVTAFFFVALAAYGLYEFSLVKTTALEIRQAIQSQPQEPEDPTMSPTPDSSNSSDEERAPLVSPRRALRAGAAPIDGSIGGLEGFIKATLAQSNKAIGCWLVLGLIEVLIRILTNHNRPRYIQIW